jgi:polysaccharide pyruvyl transferase WcaK-like protein
LSAFDDQELGEHEKVPGVTRRRRQQTGVPRVGLFGLLGSCNIGNDASMDAVLRYLRTRHPSAVIDAMCSGPEVIRENHGLDAIQMFWFDSHCSDLSGPLASVLRVPSRLLDVFRISAWVRRHDIVIVPGAGVLEASLPLRPWNTPYGLFLLSASGKLLGTRVAYVCVGAAAIQKRATRWLSSWAARLAFYRSYRDRGSLDAMRQRGLDADDPVFPDLAFSLPLPTDHPGSEGDWATIGVGIMDYNGSNDDRHWARDIHLAYLDCMRTVILWLVDNGRRVRLFIGDTDGSDAAAVQEILALVQEERPEMDASSVVAEPVENFDEVMGAMEPVGAVIATRYHNLIAALKLSKPTIALGYSQKHHMLMSDMGLAEFSHSVETVDATALLQQFLDMERRSDELRSSLLAHNSTRAAALARQFDQLDEVLFDERPPRRADRSTPALVSPLSPLT